MVKNNKRLAEKNNLALARDGARSPLYAPMSAYSDEIRSLRREAGKCEGRKSHAERNPELVALVRQLRRRRPKGRSAFAAGHFSRACGRGIMNERG